MKAIKTASKHTTHIHKYMHLHCAYKLEQYKIINQRPNRRLHKSNVGDSMCIIRRVNIPKSLLIFIVFLNAKHNHGQPFRVEGSLSFEV